MDNIIASVAKINKFLKEKLRSGRPELIGYYSEQLLDLFIGFEEELSKLKLKEYAMVQVAVFGFHLSMAGYSRLLVEHLPRTVLKRLPLQEKFTVIEGIPIFYHWWTDPTFQGFIADRTPFSRN